MTEQAGTFRAPRIGSLNEKNLHAELKDWYAQPGDRLEVSVDGFVVDIVREGLLIEVQTSGFSAVKSKLAKLLENHRVRLVYPIAREKWIVRVGDDGARLSRRKSPKRWGLDFLFLELVSIPDLLPLPGFSLEVLFTQEEEVRRYDGKCGWRRKGWVVEERRFLGVVDRHRFDSPADLLSMLPENLKSPFTTAELSAAMDTPRWVAQKMAYCLRGMGAVRAVGKTGKAVLYERQKA